MLIIPIGEATPHHIAQVLSQGGLVIMPTETLYGAMVDATNPAAVQKLNRYKNRPFGKPFSIAVADQAMAEQYVQLNESAKQLYRTFLPGPMTIISTSTHATAPGVESERGTLGIRIPDYPLIREVVRILGKPITATSANASYQKRPYSLHDIFENISESQKQLIDLAIDAGELPRNEPSTVVDTTLDDVTVIRQGDVKVNENDVVLSRSEEETRNVGKELWQKYEEYQGTRAILFALEGPMGAGKTQLAKGIARAMGITEEVVSPTFTLEHEYGSNLLHIDAWRFLQAGELEGLGIAERIRNKNVIIVEWAERVEEVLRKYDDEAVIIWVRIAYGKEENDRLITWRAL